MSRALGYTICVTALKSHQKLTCRDSMWKNIMRMTETVIITRNNIISTNKYQDKYPAVSYGYQNIANYKCPKFC